MNSLAEFKGEFKFSPRNALMIGVERECHLVRDEKIVPICPEVLAYLESSTNGRFCCYGYELSACQFEERTQGPVDISDLRESLLENQSEISEAENELGFSRVFHGAAPEDIPLDHYPCDRYDRIVGSMSQNALRAACRVAGVHVLVGMPDHAAALRVYNEVVKHFELLCRAGCLHSGQRLEGYQAVVAEVGASDWRVSPRMKLFLDHLVEISQPPEYKDWDDFYCRACCEGFVADPRRLWDFIRISVHGAIEFRMFDTTESIDTMVAWATICRSLCELVL